jgi:hypothetical protein
MRYGLAVTILTLLLTPFAAHAEKGEARPVPANGECSVPVDRRWSAQEKFVWRRVCVGELADFNKGRDYGGDLDPKGQEGLPQSRILRPSFLETILLEEKYLHALTRLGVRIVGARFTENVDLSGAQLEREFWLYKSLLEKGVNFRGVRSTQAILLNGSKITGTLNMDSLRADRNLLMTEKAEFGEVVLLGAHVGGQIDLTGSKVAGTLNMDSLHVDQNLLMGEEGEFSEVVLRNAYVGGQLDLHGSKVAGKLNMESLQVGANVFLGEGAEFARPIDFSFGKVGGGLVLAGGSFHGDVDIAGAHIVGELHLGSSQDVPARWGTNLILILRNAKVDSIQDLSDSWPAKLDLYGFTYRSLGGSLAAGEDSMIGRPVGWFEQWLGKQGSYAPTPYEQLATVLRNEGRPSAADEVLYAGKERERAQSPFLLYIWHTAIKWLIGYGYHLEWTVRWVTGFLIAGVIVLKLSGEGRKNNMPYGIAYSFDMLLPIIRLREMHSQIDLEGWARYYFYLHRIMGYVLASFLIAGISGLTK